MKVLVIPEDPTLDQYIVKPVIEKMLAEIRVTARVDLLRDPHLRGIDQALGQTMLDEIVRDNPMVDLFLVIVDRDCDRLDNVRKAAAREQEHPGKLIACLAEQEVEVWMLALHRDALSARWAEVRADCDPKERYAEPFLKAMNSVGPGGGRKAAMRSLSGNFAGLLQVCPELAQLRDRLQAWVGVSTQ